MLNTDTPMNKPSKPPHDAKKSDIVSVSDRLSAMKWGCLNDKNNSLSAKKLQNEKEKKSHSFSK